MTHENNSINSHIEAYLDYYCNCGLSAPGFAVLLKGEWGSGKTWFINKYREKLKENNQKCLYVSLYGMTSFSEIEDTFFQQLHPILSSKGMAITGKIFKGVLKGTLKVDLDGDKKDDGSLNLQIPEINIPEYLKNTDKCILIFDDLERCQIDIGHILGYINSFVEHQGLKVVIIANETELLKQDKYNSIKEKLIGKTFNVVLDFTGALEYFICSVKNTKVREFLNDNTQLIQEIYKTAGCENLRILKQIVLDFERIFDTLPEKAKNKSELLQDVLKTLMAFSIEIRRGTMLPKDISKLGEEYKSLARKQYHARQATNSDTKVNHEEFTTLEKILNTYTLLNINLHEPFPSKVWWEIFFDKGILDKNELEQSLLTSKYFQDENTPNWIRLWHFTDLTDDEFEKLLNKVEEEYAKKEFTILGEIKHITGLFLMFSDVGVYHKSKEQILKNSQLYIDHLKVINELNNPSQFHSLLDFQSYLGIGFQGTELKEFKEFCHYIDEVRELAINENMPNLAKELLLIMQNDTWKFYRMLCSTQLFDGEPLEQRYYKTPILQYIKPEEFIGNFLALQSLDRQVIVETLEQRYRSDYFNKNLLEELDWLKSIRNLLLEEAEHRKGKLSGYLLKSLVKHTLKEIIDKLEATK
jgi:nucleoside-triphosphatase THEP1